MLVLSGVGYMQLHFLQLSGSEYFEVVYLR